MHDFLLAKEIIDEVGRIVQEKKLEHIRRVNIEIGTICLAHDGFPEHIEDVSIENLEFGLKNIAKGTLLDGVGYSIKKTGGQHWKITGIEVE